MSGSLFPILLVVDEGGGGGADTEGQGACQEASEGGRHHDGQCLPTHLHYRAYLHVSSFHCIVDGSMSLFVGVTCIMYILFGVLHVLCTYC